MSDERVDPRFDPRYQRGYVSAEVSTHRIETPRRLGVPRVAPAVPAHVTAAPAAPVTPTPSPSYPASALSRGGELEPVVAEGESPRAEAPWRRPGQNPFVVALLIVATSLLLVGAWLIWWSTSTPMNYLYGSASGPMDVLIQEARYYAAPVVVTLGGMAFVGWLTVGAVRAAARW